MFNKEDFKLSCIDQKKAEENRERYWCKEYDEGFDFIDEYCEECTNYQRMIAKMLPKIKKALEG